MNYINILSIALSVTLSYVSMPRIYNMLLKGGTVENNFEGKTIPTSMGISFILVQIISISILMLFCKEKEFVIIYLFTYVLIGFAGLLDDLIGDKNIKGFKGHILSFFKGKLTTGAIKAGIGLFAALIIAKTVSKSVSEMIINTLIITLFTNVINIFDLRPGRSIKIFIIISLIIQYINSNKEFDFILFSLYGILIIYSPLDFKAKAMMGDVGSNAIGVSLGIYCVYTQGLLTKIAYLIVLALVHILAENVSISDIIDDNKILTFLDNIGR